MACALTEQDLIKESGRIASSFNNTYVPTSAWLTLSMANQEQFPEEMGDEVNVLIPERSFADKPTWNDLVSNPNETTSDDSTCAPAATTINHATTLRSYKLQQTALESEFFCLEDLRFPYKALEQIGFITKNLQENVKLFWTYRFQDEALKYFTKVVVDDTLPESVATTLPTTQATGTLNQHVLDYLYENLIGDGGGQYAYGMSEGAPVFTLLTSGLTSRDIIRKDDSVRQDFRYAEPSELLKPLGVKRSYSGFFHLSDALNVRLDYVDGAYVQRLPYVSGGATTQGTKWVRNPLWTNAGYEVSFIYTPGILKNVVPKRPKAGAGMQFQDYGYNGDFKWLNIPDRTCNPDGNVGNWRARLAHGTKVQDQKLGYALIHKRCARDFNLSGCASE